jgi:FlaA1/EpsC-like NDP-sugar epimerase
VKIRSLPAISDLVTGKYLVNQLREIEIGDLLGRSSVPPMPELFAYLKGRTILVTGAGGSIGSELCRLIIRWGPAKLVMLDSSEFALYGIDRALRGVGDCELVPVLGSVTDRELIDHTIRTQGVEVIFHAAAHKHVPLVETNPIEGIRNNVFGTLTVAASALELGVERFVLISSDKAVRPSNVMGATKRWSELIIRQHSLLADARGQQQSFSAVRFGNVLGSNGSIVPLFKEQISEGGPVTVTHPDMTRYFMSIAEAAELIVQAGAMAEGGDVFLLEMGEPVRILDLAHNMIRLAGLHVRDATRPDGDIDIAFIGVRPGEKMFEELFYDAATSTPTEHPKILRAARRNRTAATIQNALDDLNAAVTVRDAEAARRILFDFIDATC